ncbi:restriction endonuclease subunit S [Acinetobacter baumannii]|nr:restriction endonuclease subunit S [Acinetobacter baumannii]
MFEKYDAHKDSGVEWIGQIPTEWKIARAKKLFKFKKVINAKYQCDNVLSLTLRGVVNNSFDNPEGLIPKDYATYQIFNKNDLVFKLIDLENLSTSRVGLVHEKGIMSPAYIRLECNETVIPKFAYYYFYNLYLQAVFNKLGAGVRSTLSQKDLLELPYLDLCREQQIKIVDFLETKTLEIDQAITIKEQQITLLNELRQIVIQKAMTQGLDPNVLMKDSGVEWIGAIPEHWQIKKIKHVAGDFMYGTSVECNTLSSGTPVLRIPNIDELYVNFDNLKFTQLSKSETENYSLKQNDILVIRTNGNPELVGKSALIRNLDREFLFASYLIRVKPKKLINPEFLICIMNSSLVRKALTNGARTSVGNYNLNTQTLGNCFLTLPPLEEQLQILNFIKSESQKFDDLININASQIKKLKEYKTTLINDAVTGKIKVA